jgi:hypothetical protein
MWPTIESAIDFVVRMQEPCGGIAWALDPEGRPWRALLLTGTSSLHGSLVRATRIAVRLDHDRSARRRAREAVARVLRYDIDRFDRTDLPEPQGRHSMDWYDPVLGGIARSRRPTASRLDVVVAAVASAYALGTQRPCAGGACGARAWRGQLA